MSDFFSRFGKCDEDRRSRILLTRGTALHVVARDPVDGAEWPARLEDCVAQRAAQSPLRTGSGFAGPARTDQPLNKSLRDLFRVERCRTAPAPWSFRPAAKSACR